ncbi:metal ABC transporter ATP-binding protein [Thermotalea metallivorans]|uniref:High-affinity zinc uptake system ATP-binding protein ZnuC n=1 Tax=Thermotalea metallivorans TaxID=520762 RepID=A0A140L6G0_9FIRM|nr:metal ABC transporter ATP-binding protein [Thermotalea metallivorans]KXG76135.1 High-affinity zinc uptake system ATP-binding protein ZnuC [Thermotalea metallivorans]
MEKVISLKDVSFGYDQNLVLENIHLDVFQGDYLGIVGPNGSAKSTLLKLMLGILKPQRGTIQIFGQDIEKFRDWGKIGYVAQKATSFNVGFPATVEEVVGGNLYTSIGLCRGIKRIHRDKIHKALEFVGMEDYCNRLIGNLSGGQQQKVFIARALVSSPQIIFLDEPTVGIDLKSQEEFYRLLEKLHKEMQITILMVSHDIGVITEKVTRVACMGDKRLITHQSCCNIPFSEVMAQFYGEKMKLMLHHHQH